MFSVHVPVIKEKIHELKNSQSLDYVSGEKLLTKISTLSVASTLFDDNTSIILTRLFSLIESWIYIHTNIKLIDNGQLPLYGTETINLVLYGNNVVNNYIKTSIRNQTENKNIVHDLNKIHSLDLDEKTEFQYDLHISTSNANRFEIIEKYVIESLVDILNIFSEGFDALFQFSDDLKTFDLIYQQIKTPTIDIEIDYSKKNLIELKKLMEIPFFNFSIDLMFYPSAQKISQARNTNYELTDLINSQLKELENQSGDIMYFPYIYYFSRKIIGTTTKPLLVMKFLTRISKIKFMNVLNSLLKINFIAMNIRKISFIILRII